MLVSVHPACLSSCRPASCSPAALHHLLHHGRHLLHHQASSAASWASSRRIARAGRSASDRPPGPRSRLARAPAAGWCGSVWARATPDMASMARVVDRIRIFMVVFLFRPSLEAGAGWPRSMPPEIGPARGNFPAVASPFQGQRPNGRPRRGAGSGQEFQEAAEAPPARCPAPGTPRNCHHAGAEGVRKSCTPRRAEWRDRQRNSQVRSHDCNPDGSRKRHGGRPGPPSRPRSSFCPNR